MKPNNNNKNKTKQITRERVNINPKRPALNEISK